MLTKEASEAHRLLDVRAGGPVVPQHDKIQQFSKV